MSGKPFNPARRADSQPNLQPGRQQGGIKQHQQPPKWTEMWWAENRGVKGEESLKEFEGRKGRG